MNVQAHFTDIASAIVTELDSAQRSIEAAVAWLTDLNLFEALLKAARRGCQVRLALLDDAINRRSGLNLERLRAVSGQVFWIPEGESGQGSLHHKFCVIDEDEVITGSYNWTRRASRADENILRVRGNAALAAGYTEAFAQLLDKYRLRPRAMASEALIDRYVNHWSWKGLSRNMALPWSETLIERYADRWRWRWLNWNKALP